MEGHRHLLLNDSYTSLHLSESELGNLNLSLMNKSALPCSISACQVQGEA